MDSKDFDTSGIGSVRRPQLIKRAIWHWPIGALIVLLIVIFSIFPSTDEGAVSGHVNIKLLGTSMAGKPGYTVAGYKCGHGIRQVPWSKYAPICEPAWHGDNGGSTYPGVTSTTITVTYREPNVAGASVLQGIFGSGLGTNQEAINTMQAYVNLFNKTFELYGRHVVLKPFQGKGDVVNELQGKDLEQAQADSLTAKSLNAFADVSLLDSTQIYDQFLSDQGIIAIGAIAQPEWWFKDYAPYEYTPNANCDTGVRSLAVAIGRSIANLPAVFSASPIEQTKTRVFGLIYPEDPTYSSCGQLLTSLLSSEYGITMARVIQYTINLSQETPEALNAITQMKASGVTTVLCGCDPIYPFLLTYDAENQKYYPEWMVLDFEDIFTQVYDQNEFKYSVSTGPLYPPADQQEAYKVYQLSGDKNVISPQFTEIYQPLILLFDALQAAGPDLNPYTFEQGFFRLPESLPGGDYGRWKFGQGRFSPVSEFDVIQWSTSTISPQNAKLGTYIPCFNGKRFDLSPQGAKQLPYHQQLDCPSLHKNTGG
jgi:hypothetical protein